MYLYEEDVMRDREATALYKDGKITEEEWKRIKRINARKRERKYEQSEKGRETRRKRNVEREDYKEYREKMNAYSREYYRKNREKILEYKKRRYGIKDWNSYCKKRWSSFFY